MPHRPKGMTWEPLARVAQLPRKIPSFDASGMRRSRARRVSAYANASWRERSAWHLRGCLGHFTSAKPLWKLVNETARASATEDPRFWSYPITPDELDRLSIEISVLSPLQRIANPLAIELGVDGIYIRRGAAAGCFLPQVATETGWSKEEFLSHCCSHKAGLSADAWRDPDTEVLTFRAEVFGETE